MSDVENNSNFNNPNQTKNSSPDSKSNQSSGKGHQNSGNQENTKNQNKSRRRRKPNNRNQHNNQNSNNKRNNRSGNNRDNNARNTINSPWGMNPLPTQTGIQTRSQRGEFSKNWWARRWIETLERLMQGVRLSRGQHYARMGQVVSLEEIKGGVLARVQGSRPKPYRVTIQLAPFNVKQWEKVFDLLSEKSIYMAKLLVGEMPQDIESVFNQAGASLFPEHAADLQMKCTCPDKITPCKHVAATHYILGDRFDEDPFLIFRMRGRSQEQILEALRQRRGAQADMEIDPKEYPSRGTTPKKRHFPETLQRFWDIQQDLNQVNVQVRMPNIPQPLLKRLGEPEFSSQLTLQGQLEESYDLTSQFAIMIAYADTTDNSTNGNGNGNGD